MRVTVQARVTMTVTLDQYQGEEKSLAQVKAEMADTIRDHVSKSLRPDRDDDVQVKAVVDDVTVQSSNLVG